MEDSSKTGHLPLRATKLTLTFQDGHTEEYPVFIAVLAKGILPQKLEVGGIERVVYRALKEDFSTQAIASIAAEPVVLAGLLEALTSIREELIEGLDLDTLIQVVAAQKALRTLTKRTQTEFKSVKRRVDTN